MDAEATGKLYSSAQVSAVVTRPSPNISEMTKSLIAEAEARWSELLTRTETLLFHKNSLLPKGQVKLGKYETHRPSIKVISEYVDAMEEKDSKSDSKQYAYNYKKVRELYQKEWADACAKLVADAMSDVMAIWGVVDHVGFQHALKSLCNKYTASIKKTWTNDVSGLYSAWRAEYRTLPTARYEWTAFKNVHPHMLKVHNYNVDRTQKAQLNQFLKDLREIWVLTFLKDRMAAIEDAMDAIQREKITSNVYIKNDGTHITQEAYYPDVTTIRPFDVVHIKAEDAPLFKGYPTKAKLWARCTPVLSSEGQVIASGRARPLDKDLGSDQRWVADGDYWDEITGTWTAVDNRLNYQIKASDINNSPTLGVQSYPLGNELISRSSFRLTEGSKFLCHFNRGLDALGSFTMSMVVSPNPTQNPYPLLDYWYGEESPEYGHRMAWWLNDRLDFLYGGTGGSVDQLAALNKVRPLVVTSVVTSDECATYVGYSHRHNLKTTVKSKVDNHMQWMRFQVGGTYLALNDDQHADFNLYEMNLWLRPLSNDEVIALHSDYYSIYGVSNDWR